MYAVTKNISLSDEEVVFKFIRASGPGGQNVNKVSTAVQLRFDIRKSASLPNTVKRRLSGIASNRVTGDGVLVIDARNHRTQLKNKEEALSRLGDLIKKAAIIPKRRVSGKPPIRSKKKRLESKRQRGELKQSRKRVEEK